MPTDQEIIANWYASVYDQCETGTDDVEFLLKVLGPDPLRVLEAACGTGRILVPLARAGHDAAGFDMNEAMLARIAAKAAGLENIAWHVADALAQPWGGDYDVVVLAGNVLFNIETGGDYREAQRLLLRRAYDALRPGGHIYLDFDCHPRPARMFRPRKTQRVVFAGTDSAGTHGTYSLMPGGGYDKAARTAYGPRRTEVTTREGRKIVQESVSRKRVLALKVVLAWLEELGFTPEQVWGGYDGKPAGRRAGRAIIYAKKGSTNHEQLPTHSKVRPGMDRGQLDGPEPAVAP